MYKPKNITFLFLLFFSLTSCNKDDVMMPDPGEMDPVVQEDITAVDNRVQSFMEKYNITGASIAVSKNEKMVYTKGYGMANVSKSELVTPEHVFRVASISKMFTGVAILRLVEDGKLNLDDKVFGPSGILGNKFGTATLTDQELEITVDHLLHNSFGGWGVASGGDPIDYFPSYNNDEFIEYLLNEWDLVYPIEDTYVYSNTGYWLLARIVEKVTEESFSNFVKNIFNPTGISSLHYTKFTREDRQAKEVEYYGQDGEEDYVYKISSRRDGDGGVVISAPDLLRAVCALDKLPLRENVLSDNTIELLRGNGPLSPNWGRGIGFWNEQQFWWTTGALPATRSWLISRYDGLSVVMILNSKSNDSSFDIDFNNTISAIANDATIPWKNGLDQF
ncbi:serine hydrolase domain-containing protein [Portibacter lacus]|uniref:Penicillin-binding protein n=1 Tax=Portibacter lacus TaxID=1099794 RepID=A0AA37WIB7_9BACT|nr:serine hydrolase domain-containing protein [Portibacter lacus]GLR19620.1 penicillin-binding protein [Portibacter lacus]